MQPAVLLFGRVGGGARGTWVRRELRVPRSVYITCIYAQCAHTDKSTSKGPTDVVSCGRNGGDGMEVWRRMTHFYTWIEVEDEGPEEMDATKPKHAVPYLVRTTDKLQRMRRAM